MERFWSPANDNTIQQVLAAQVDGSLESTTVNPPSGGWPEGQGFRVNLVKDVNDLNTILAQSSQFSIGLTTSSSSASTSVTLVSATTALATTATAPATVATLAAPSTVTHATSSVSASSTTGTAKPNSASKVFIHVGSVPLLAALCYFLA
ncbi:hypothetical protein H0H92_014923 [Tricholoma furcatifolium]|nr:hypothetical protein H0H92_014923 [Tricholoma furcatifolium]